MRPFITIFTLCLVVFMILMGVNWGMYHHAYSEEELMIVAEEHLQHLIYKHIGTPNNEILEAIIPLYVRNLREQVLKAGPRYYVTKTGIKYAMESVPIHGPYKSRFVSLLRYF